MKRTKFNGKELKERGMKASSDHAELTNIGWNQMAFDMLVECPLILFMTENLRAWAYRNGLPIPPTEKAWGSVIIRAAKAGVIIHQGYQKVTNKQAHARPASLWLKA